MKEKQKKGDAIKNTNVVCSQSQLSTKATKNYPFYLWFITEQTTTSADGNGQITIRETWLFNRILICRRQHIDKIASFSFNGVAG